MTDESKHTLNILHLKEIEANIERCVENDIEHDTKVRPEIVERLSLLYRALTRTRHNQGEEKDG